MFDTFDQSRAHGLVSLPSPHGLVSLPSPAHNNLNHALSEIATGLLVLKIHTPVCCLLRCPTNKQVMCPRTVRESKRGCTEPRDRGLLAASIVGSLPGIVYPLQTGWCLLYCLCAHAQILQLETHIVRTRFARTSLPFASPLHIPPSNSFLHYSNDTQTGSMYSLLLR